MALAAAATATQWKPSCLVSIGTSRCCVRAQAAAGKSSDAGIVIVGGGLSGLAAAIRLQEAGAHFHIVEASDGVGGRVRTDEVDGFLLDRGFQIFITSYPQARKLLDYEALQLHTFFAGASVWLGNGKAPGNAGNGFHLVADPVRHLTDALGTVFNPVGTLTDKLLVGFVRLKCVAKPFYEEALEEEECDIATMLQREGFSRSIVNSFFRPFFGGIFFDHQLQTSSRLFSFVFKCLAIGDNTLPAKGIGDIPKQLLSSLPEGSVSLNSKVAELLTDGAGRFCGVKLADGSVMNASRGVILAVEEPEAARLMGKKKMLKKPRSTVCLYFSSAVKPPVEKPILLLNGCGSGIVNNMFFPTAVCPAYSPPGKTLVSVSLVGSHEEKSDAELERAVRDELGCWFGRERVAEWRHLRTYRVAYAQPDQAPPTDLRKDAFVQDGLYVCGDHVHSATFDGALLSGRRAADRLLSLR